MKYFIIFSIVHCSFLTQAQDLEQPVPNRLVKPLACGVWGDENWSELAAYRTKRGWTNDPNTGAVIRERDQNLYDLMESRDFTYHTDPIVYRWVIKDTSIMYNIFIRNKVTGQDVYRTVDNFCGLKIDLNKLFDQEGVLELVVHVVRVKDRDDAFHWGIGGQLRFEENKKLSGPVQYQSFGIDDPSARFRKQADIYAANGNYRDAFVALELALENKNDIDSTRALYWHLHNQEEIERYEKKR